MIYNFKLTFLIQLIFNYVIFEVLNMQAPIDIPLTHFHKKHKSLTNDQIQTTNFNSNPEKKEIINHPQMSVMDPLKHALESRHHDKEITKPSPKLQGSPKKTRLKTTKIQTGSTTEEALTSIQSQKQDISNKLETILRHYKEIHEDEFIFSSRNPRKENEIKEFLTKLKYQKRERRDRIQSLSVQIPRKNQNQTSQDIIQRKKRIEERHLHKMKQIQEGQKKREEQHNRFKQFYKQYRKSKPMYIIKKEQFQHKIQLQEIESQLVLNQHSKKFKPFSEQDFEEHLLKHNQFLNDLQREKQYQKRKFEELIQLENEKLQDIWKGHCHKIVENEELQRRRQKDQPKAMRNKIRKYSIEVRQNLRNKSPQINQSEQTQPNSHRILKRYKFMNGQAFGLVEDKAPLQISVKDQHRIGNQYLEMIKALTKKKQQRPEPLFDSPPKSVSPTKQSVPRCQRQIDPLYSYHPKSTTLSPDRYSIKKLMHQMRNFDVNLKHDQKILKMQKLPSVNEYQERQRAIDLKLVRGIENKLSVLARM